MKRLSRFTFLLFLVLSVSACGERDQKPSSVSEKPLPIGEGDIISCPVQMGGKWGFIDKTGKYAINPRFERNNITED